MNMSAVEVTEKCMVCAEETSEARLPAKYHSIIVDLLEVFWKYADLGETPPASLIARRKDGYCLCKQCKHTLMDIHKTHAEIEETQKEINEVVAQAAAKIIMSSDAAEIEGRLTPDHVVKTENDDDPLLSSNQGSEFRGNNEEVDEELERQTREFRKLVAERFSPKVRISQKDRLVCDVAAKNLDVVTDSAVESPGAVVLCNHSYGVSVVSQGAVPILQKHLRGNLLPLRIGGHQSDVTNTCEEDVDREWKCGCCGFLFDDSVELLQHLATHQQKSPRQDGNDTRSDVAEIADGDSTSDRSDHGHEIVPAEDDQTRAYPENNLEENFVSKTLSKKGVPPSQRASKHKCTHCGASFKDNWHLKRHEKSHEKNRFKCTYEGCGKSFAVNSELENHEQVHVCEQPDTIFQVGAKASSMKPKSSSRRRTRGKKNKPDPEKESSDMDEDDVIVLD